MPRLSSQRIEVADDYEVVQHLYLERGWSDGLPIVPPTPERVEAMLAAVDLPPGHVIAEIPPNWGAATVERLAINAVMAGCLPEYFPVIVAAADAMGDPAFNLYAIQATTHPCAPLLIVNGPIRETLEMNASSGAFGPGWRANATIGRAVRLILLNVGGGHPGVGDMATHGAPSKFSYCVAENEELNPWQPLHVDRGFDRSQSTVTVIAGEPPHNINDHSGRSAGDILTIVAGAMAVTGANNAYTGGETLLALGSGACGYHRRRRPEQGGCGGMVNAPRAHSSGTVHRRHVGGAFPAGAGRSRADGPQRRRSGHYRAGRAGETFLLGAYFRWHHHVCHQANRLDGNPRSLPLCHNDCDMIHNVDADQR